MFGQGQQRRDARLVVVFQKVNAALDEFRRMRLDMFDDCARLVPDDMVVEQFVVGEIKPSDCKRASRSQ
jgi:hypothetical protein